LGPIDVKVADQRLGDEPEALGRLGSVATIARSRAGDIARVASELRFYNRVLLEIRVAATLLLKGGTDHVRDLSEPFTARPERALAADTAARPVRATAVSVATTIRTGSLC
jgi:hypothetical protein